MKNNKLTVAVWARILDGRQWTPAEVNAAADHGKLPKRLVGSNIEKLAKQKAARGMPERALQAVSQKSRPAHEQ